MSGMKHIFIFTMAALLLACGSSNSDAGGNDSSPAAKTGSETPAYSGTEKPAGAAAVTHDNNQPASNEFVISGKIANAPPQPVLLDKYSFIDNHKNTAAAMIAADGSFTIKGHIEQPGLYLIRMNNNINWLVILDKGSFTFTADANNAYKHSITGTPESEMFSAFIAKASDNQAALNQLNQQLNIAKALGQMQQVVSIQQQYQTRHEESQKHIRSAMENFSARPLQALFAASLLNAEENAEYLDNFIAQAGRQLPGSVYVRELKQRVDAVTRLAIGRVAPDIKLKSPKGETVSLSSTRGKVVLLDFWASWCRPCRMENPNVVRLYDRYHAKGFDIFSVSLDQSMERWVNAIKADNLKWKNHGSTLQGWQCPVAATYEVHSIPNTLLLDRDGKIIAKNLRGAELEKKLRELFGV